MDNYKKLAKKLITNFNSDRGGVLQLSSELCLDCKRGANAITDLLIENQSLRNAANGLKARAEAAEARAEKAERKRDAAVKELDAVSSAVDDLSDFIDEQIFPMVQYDMYTSLRDSADAISVWQYEKEWRDPSGKEGLMGERMDQR